MAKTLERDKALELRRNGESIRDIAKSLKISKSTASIWCRDISLTSKQIKKLHEKMIIGSYPGRLKGAMANYEKRIKRIKDASLLGKAKIGKLSERDLLIATVALYWGEGSKKSRQLTINNSDPEMIKFIMVAFRRIWNVSENRFAFHIGINKVHKSRDEEIKKYWSNVVGVPKSQFRKTIFIKAKNKKVYKNFLNHYGTLTIRIKQPMSIYYPMMGLIEGLIKGIN